MSRINPPYSLTKSELDQTLSQKIGESMERLQKAKELNAELGDKITQRDAVIQKLIEAADNYLSIPGDKLILRADLRIAIDFARKVIE